LDAAVEEAVRQDARVIAIHVKVGALSGVLPEALSSAFELARAGSPLEHAELVVKEVAATAHCTTCDAERPVVSVQQLCCPICGTATPDLIQGRELEIVALEIAGP
jgi:hydrogenase nickel incorporation protein HypA/HybF